MPLVSLTTNASSKSDENPAFGEKRRSRLVTTETKRICPHGRLPFLLLKSYESLSLISASSPRRSSTPSPSPLPPPPPPPEEEAEEEASGTIPFQLQFDKPIPSQMKLAEWNLEKDMLAMVTQDSKILNAIVMAFPNISSALSIISNEDAPSKSPANFSKSTTGNPSSTSVSLTPSTAPGAMEVANGTTKSLLFYGGSTERVAALTLHLLSSALMVVPICATHAEKPHL